MASLYTFLGRVGVLTGCNVMRTAIPHSDQDEADDEDDPGCRGTDSGSCCGTGAETSCREGMQDWRHSSGGRNLKSLSGGIF